MYVKKPNSLRWKIQKNMESFNNYWTNLDWHSLFFDGASKVNLGLVGAGGVIYYPGGTNGKFILGV